MRIAPALLSCLVLAGCAPLEIHGARTSALARAAATHEYPGPPPPAERATGAAVSPVAAIEAFATTYINWSASTVAAQLRTLAAESIGPARSAMAVAATQTAQDYELQRGGIENSGTVEAVAPLAGQSDQYVVVTREQTSATATAAYQGLGPAWHLTLATVAEIAPGRWVLSGWEPES